MDDTSYHSNSQRYKKDTEKSFLPTPGLSILIPLPKSKVMLLVIFPETFYALKSKYEYILISLLYSKIAADYIHESALYFSHISLYPGPYSGLCWHIRAAPLANLFFQSCIVLLAEEVLSCIWPVSYWWTFRFSIFCHHKQCYGG